MKTTGITRRIDELGRIVIPKEIRNNMRIKPGELMEIYLSDLETITLKKHDVITGEESFIKNYVNHLASVLKANVYLTSLSEVLFINNKDTNRIGLSASAEKLFSNGIESVNQKETISLTDDIVINKPFSVSPLIPNGDLVGYLIIENKKEVDNNKDLISFSTSLLSDYLEQN